jgi:hypothetical protein
MDSCFCRPYMDMGHSSLAWRQRSPTVVSLPHPSFVRTSQGCTLDEGFEDGVGLTVACIGGSSSSGESSSDPLTEEDPA